jgi:hypothetical protein
MNYRLSIPWSWRKLIGKESTQFCGEAAEKF